ncbi:MAG: murein hydrolase activator EnvC family protein [Caulobacteraceae bacterium]
MLLGVLLAAVASHAGPSARTGAELRAATISRDRAELSRVLGELELVELSRPSSHLERVRRPRAAARSASLADALQRGLAQRARALASEIRALEAVGDVSFQGPALPMVKRARILDHFGQQRADGSRASGLQVALAPGAQVSSPAPALVEYAGRLADVGDVVILKLDDADHVVVEGLGSLAVYPGQRIEAGALIGRMSRPASELYLELRRGGRPVDPSRLIAARRR